MRVLADGSWLTRRRVRDIAIISALGGIAMLLLLTFGGSGTLDPFGKPIGTDFTAFWNAGKLANAGAAVSAWDFQTLNANVRATHPGSDFETAWVYPPIFLLVASPLALLPYLPALFLWQAAGVIFLALTLHSILKDWRAVLICIASPFTPMVLGGGQNSYFTAALLGAGLLTLADGRTAGAAYFGALAYKPQLALQIGPLLLFTRKWRAFAVAAASTVALVAISIVIWGTSAWLAFIDSSAVARHFMEQGSVGFYKSASLFAIFRQWGASIPVAYAIQAVGAVAGVALLWRLRGGSPYLLSAAVCAAAGLSTPYLLDYDIAIVGVGGVFLFVEARRTGFLPYERTVLAYIWGTPWFGRAASEFASLPLLGLTPLLLAYFVLRRHAATASPCRR